MLELLSLGEKNACEGAARGPWETLIKARKPLGGHLFLHVGCLFVAREIEMFTRNCHSNGSKRGSFGNWFQKGRETRKVCSTPQAHTDCIKLTSKNKTIPSTFFYEKSDILRKRTPERSSQLERLVSAIDKKM